MNQAHADMDDMGEWAESHPITQRAHRALPLDPAWPTRRAYIPQGCDQQGRLEPTIPPKPAEACTEVGFEDQSESADRDVVLWMLKGFAVVLASLFCAWVVAGWPYA